MKVDFFKMLSKISKIRLLTVTVVTSRVYSPNVYLLGSQEVVYPNLI